MKCDNRCFYCNEFDQDGIFCWECKENSFYLFMTPEEWLKDFEENIK